MNTISEEMIVAMFFERNERAISETSSSFGKLFRRIAFNITGSSRDAEECENDTYVRLWNTIPPQKPKSLKAYGAKIVRNLAIDVQKRTHTSKRTFDLLADEFDEAIPLCNMDTDSIDTQSLGKLIDNFLRKLDTETRVMFVLRYFNGERLSGIATRIGCSESSVKSQLHRTRNKLRDYLQKEGFGI